MERGDFDKNLKTMIKLKITTRNLLLTPYLKRSICVLCDFAVIKGSFLLSRLCAQRPEKPFS